MGTVICSISSSARRQRAMSACWTLATALLLGLGVSAVARGDSDDRIHLAGTFNNWAVSDDSFKLNRVGDRYELQRYMGCGLYEFKFVFNGSWQRHLGDAGGENRLAQPGGNIHLVCPQSGEYLIWLDVDKKMWGMEHRPASRPYAIVTIERVSCDHYILDPSQSIPTAGKTLLYRWGSGSSDLGPNDWYIERKEYTDHLFLNAAGQLELQLVVTDGELADTATVNGTFGNGFQMSARTNKTASAGMHLVGEDLWAASYTADHDGTEIFIVTGTGRGTDTNPTSLTVRKGRTYYVLYDNALRSISAETSGYHYFLYDPKSDDRLPKDLVIERVDIVGSFNNWKVGMTPVRRIHPAKYEALVPLPEGLHHYKIAVNGAIFLEDRTADPKLSAPDNHGGRDSGLLIGDDAKQFGEAKPDHIAVDALRHTTRRDEYFGPYSRTDALVTLRTLANDVESARIWADDSNDPIPLARSESRLGFDFWKATVNAPSARATYRFEVIDGNTTRWLDADGAHENRSEANHPFTAEIKMNFDTPDWARKVVWYQIFPERFRNGTPDNDPPRTAPWSHKWHAPYKAPSDVKTGSPADFIENGGFFDYIFDRRYGGDLQGVRDKLGYLRDLGINAIYFNPIFLAESMHKYDASDFRHIDDFFGIKDSLKKIQGETIDPATWQWSESDKLFLEFLNEAHRMGFKVIIDGVFNHVGRDFWAFKDVLKNGRESKFAGWFDIVSWEPFHYKAWDGDDGSLPRLKHDDALGLAAPVREHLFAVTKRWMDPNGDGDPSDGIDGWRLDVAADINANFWKDWRKLVKSINPDAYIVAELWEESKPWLDGRTFDAVMNYPFAVRAQQFFVNKAKATKPSEFDQALKEMLGWYQPQVNYVLQNLYDSHDTDRLASMFMNPDLEYDKSNRVQDNGPNYNEAKPTPDCYHRMKAMVTFQMTFLGAPMVYYGDEVGMFGADDPSDRKPMLWDDLPPNDDPEERIEKDVLEHYRRLIAIRNTYPALQSGTFRTITCRDDLGVYGFCRTSGRESVIVVFNNSDKSHRLNLPSPWPDGSKIARLDDPNQTELIMPAKDAPTSRPKVRPMADYESNLKVENGLLHGMMLEPRSAAVFGKVGS